MASEGTSNSGLADRQWPEAMQATEPSSSQQDMSEWSTGVSVAAISCMP